MKTPDLKPRTMTLSVEYANKLLGMQYDSREISGLLGKMRYGTKDGGKGSNGITVLVPPYRTDILHPIDLVEDLAIAYGYENFTPQMPAIATVGLKDPIERFANDLRELMTGGGFQEVMTLTMTNKENLYARMLLPEEETVETENPVSIEHSVARTWLMPSLMSVLETNKNREYPQKVFEIGECLTAEGQNRKKLSALAAHSKANYSGMKAIACGLLESIGLECGVKSHTHSSFIKGRCAATAYGFFGEIHPQVLENYGLEVPACGMELDVELLYKRGI
ncbi:MAG: hypothetical protein JW724_00680 [Candidatus Altiarchaeota archaeon]|nr:hypothetical protein [Candidatus Altiarchaeota archaeon]